MKGASTPVLIVGAGPTGLSLANLLVKMGVDFLLIDQNRGPSRSSKAFAIHARSLEIFGQLGIAAAAIEKGSVDNRLHLYSKEKELADIRLYQLLPDETPYPYFLVLAQNKTEQLLIDALQKQGHDVKWQHKLIQLHQGSAGANVTICGPDGTEQKLQVRYLIGCDGAGSTVRELAGFRFKGKTYSPTFYLADGGLDWSFAHGDIYFTMAPGHLSIIFSFSEKGRYRIFNFLHKGQQKQAGELNAASFQAILDTNPYVPKRLKDADWFSVYKIHSRLTSHFHQGCICLAGDAAHVHSPVGGQGMNTGIQDAYNLAWKLALVVQASASPALLATYHQERYPIARALHRTTDRYFQLMIRQGKAADLFRLYVFPQMFRLITAVGWLRKALFRRLSQLAIHYRFSSLSSDPLPAEFRSRAARPGDRAPWVQVCCAGRVQSIFDLTGAAHFTLLLVAEERKGKAMEEMRYYFAEHPSGWIRAYVLEREKNEMFCNRYGIQKEAAVLIRPDGHIGYRGKVRAIASIKNYLKQFIEEI